MIHEKRIKRPMSAVAEASDIDTAHGWAKRLLKYEQERSGLSAEELRPVLARHIGVAPGTIENIQRKRIKEPSSSLMRKLRDALTRELQAEAKRHEHEVHVLEQTGCDPRDGEIAEVAAGLARIREILARE